MKKIKKSFAVMLIGIMLFSVEAYAAEDEQIFSTGDYVVYNNDGIMPLYTYIDVISAALTIDDNGRCVFTGSGTALGYDVKIEIYLQRSWNQIIWDDIMGGIKTFNQSGALEYSLNLQPNNYYYRAKVVVSVLDGNKNTIESETIYSSTERY